MNPYLHASFYKKFTWFFFQALSGNVSMRSMILACSTVALVILAYVSMQIYASKTLEKTSDLRQEETLCQEKVNQLTSIYTSLASRSKVVRYCENRLGMVEASDNAMIRIAVERGSDELSKLVQGRGEKIWSQTHLAFRNTLTPR